MSDGSLSGSEGVNEVDYDQSLSCDDEVPVEPGRVPGRASTIANESTWTAYRGSDGPANENAEIEYGYGDSDPEMRAERAEESDDDVDSAEEADGGQPEGDGEPDDDMKNSVSAGDEVADDEEDPRRETSGDMRDQSDDEGDDYDESRTGEGERYDHEGEVEAEDAEDPENAEEEDDEEADEEDELDPEMNADEHGQDANDSPVLHGNRGEIREARSIPDESYSDDGRSLDASPLRPEARDEDISDANRSEGEEDFEEDAQYAGHRDGDDVEDLDDPDAMRRDGSDRDHPADQEPSESLEPSKPHRVQIGKVARSDEDEKLHDRNTRYQASMDRSGSDNDDTGVARSPLSPGQVSKPIADTGDSPNADASSVPDAAGRVPRALIDTPNSPSTGRPKRLRRRPQRWEGSPLETKSAKRLSGSGGATAGDSGHPPSRGANVQAPLHIMGDSAAVAGNAMEQDESMLDRDNTKFTARAEDLSTASVRSMESGSPPPEPVDALERMHTAVRRMRMAPSKRDVIEDFHAWQLKAISTESNYQKSLHNHLRRKLRRRAVRALERDRIEEEALRNACSMAPSVDDDNGESRRKAKKMKHLDPGIGLIPEKIRLPLEAYLPRRVCKAERCMSVDDLVSQLPSPPVRKSGERVSLHVWAPPTDSEAISNGDGGSDLDGDNNDKEAS